MRLQSWMDTKNTRETRRIVRRIIRLENELEQGIAKNVPATEAALLAAYDNLRKECAK